jgi:hypothetical protein
VSRFPVAFRLPAFASRVILSPLRIEPSLRSAYRVVPGPHRDSTFRTHELLPPGRVPSLPRGGRCSHGRLQVSGRRLPHPIGKVPTSRPKIHHPELNLTRHH